MVQGECLLMTECLKKKKKKLSRDLFSQVSSFPLFFYVPLLLHNLWPIHKRIIKKTLFYATIYQHVRMKQVMHIFYVQNSKWPLIFLFLLSFPGWGSQFLKSKRLSMPLFHEGRNSVCLDHCLIPKPRIDPAHSRLSINVCT